MYRRNRYFFSLAENYLFPEVQKRVQQFRQSHPQTDLVNLSVGDTSEPISPDVIAHLKLKVKELGQRENYSGYGEERGSGRLRKLLCERYYPHLNEDEIFISDGAKCDIGRLQLLFDRDITVAVQDPTYPVYVDTSLLTGKQAIVYLPSLPENHFFPSIDAIPPCDLLFICSPNNPTGSAATCEQLTQLVQWAKETQCIIIFDAAYAAFIRDQNLPRSIYEIEGAEAVAIEVNSFSKSIGFTGVRLGWSVVPRALGQIHHDFCRLTATFFNGASNIAQAGGVAALSDEGLQSIQTSCDFYLQNAQLLRKALFTRGARVYGGEHAPYLWIDCEGNDAWELFDQVMKETHIITTPGIGFGKKGEGFLRLSAFGARELILEGAKRIETSWPSSLVPSLT